MTTYSSANYYQGIHAKDDEMEIFWVVIGLVVVAIYLINQNKAKTTDKTVIRQTDTYKTDTGEIRVERTKVIDSTQTTFHPAQQKQTTPKEAYHNAINQVDYSSRIVPEPVQKKIESCPLETVSSRDDVCEPALALKQNNINELSKQCTRCRIQLPFSKFSKSSKHSDGVTVWCTDCLRGEKNTRHMKWCPRCKIRRKRTSFYPSNDNADKLMAWCKSCVDARRKR